jgi:hypothetical protein
MVWKVGGQSHKVLEEHHNPSYTVDNKTSSNDKVVPFHEMKTRSGE